MVHPFVRDSFCGRLIYRVSGRKWYQEEQPTYQIPAGCLHAKNPLDSEQSLNSPIVVTWDGDEDPDNPQNWPVLTKAVFVFAISFLTMTVYMASAIYTPGVDEIMARFDVNSSVAMLPLSVFVFGYGIGPMWFSPMLENAMFGRTLVYVTTLFVFCILQIPTALVNNFAGLCVLRFLGGIFALPALATGGGSVGDVLDVAYIPSGLAAWSMGSVAGPSLGPVIGAALVVAGGWRWTFWFMSILSGACLLLLLVTLPETFPPTLLARKADRLRRLTGNCLITSEGEVANSELNTKQLVADILWRPIEVTILEPVVLLIDVYIALVYAIIYTWFEAFPIVFNEVHGFTRMTGGTIFLTVIIGIVIGGFVYLWVIYRRFTAPILAGLWPVPETFIPMAIVGSVMMPTGIFVFGWTAAADITWVAPAIGAAVFSCSAFFLFQSLFSYISFSFAPRYVASCFASNGFTRACIGGAFPLFARPLFLNIKNSRFPVAYGSTILGSISLLMIAIPVLFLLNGPRLRARSKYKAQW